MDVDASWASVPQLFRSAAPLPLRWEPIFAPLRAGKIDDLMVVAQLGQSLDGRIATVTGHSHYINGEDGLDHLHRLRALVDAVVVGVGTVAADNPQLTVRRVAGPNPARVVIDPRGRLPADRKIFAADGAKQFVVTSDEQSPDARAGVELIPLPCREGRIAPAAILSALAARGMRRILIEGGGHTISAFLQAGCLDRLHVVIAPVIIGAGTASLNLAPITHMAEALRPDVATHRLGPEILFDCDLSAQRVPIGVANKST
jgi:riboflavin-specific deaminase-like protein